MKLIAKVVALLKEVLQYCNHDCRSGQYQQCLFDSFSDRFFSCTSSRIVQPEKTLMKVLPEIKILMLQPVKPFGPGTPCCEFPYPPNTKAHFALELKFFTNKIVLYESKYLEDCLYNCFDTSGKKFPLLSKRAKIHVTSS